MLLNDDGKAAIGSVKIVQQLVKTKFEKSIFGRKSDESKILKERSTSKIRREISRPWTIKDEWC